MSKKVTIIKVMLLSFMVLTSYRQAGVVYAAEIIQSQNSKKEQNKETSKVIDPHAANVRYQFQDTEMDFVFGGMILSATMNHGCEIGEAFRTAANIKDGDAASWQEEWIKTARLVEARGDQSLARGHKVSAREQLQRASYYYRAALLSMPPSDLRFKKTALKSRALLRKAGKLFEPQLEYIEIPFEDTILPGYFRRAAPGETPRQTLIMIGGSETFAEDLFFYISTQAFDRGYNFLTVDLPGQGMLPFEGKFLQRNMHVSMKAVVDYALSRRDIDAKRLTVYGYSTGGFIVPQAAMHDKRIKAVAMSHCVVDGYAEVANMPIATPEMVKNWSSFKRGTYQSLAWRYGLQPDDVSGLLKANEGFIFDPVRVTTPALILVAGGEYQSPEIQRQTKLCKDFKEAQPLKQFLGEPLSRKLNVSTFEYRLQQMDEWGIDMQAVSIPPEYSYWADRDLARRIVQIQNNKIAELCAAHPDRFVGIGAVAMQHPELAAEQMEEGAKKLGLRGFEIGGSINGEELSLPKFHPFWAKAEELGTLIFIHPTGFAAGERRFQGKGRSDRCFGEPQSCKTGPKRPSEYLKQLYYDSLVFTNEGMRHMIAEVGASQIVIGTDYPFGWEPDVVGYILGVPRLTNDQKWAILNGNAARLLQISS
jgi:predicted TIM-barrel fold metal-dependent hydrolase